MSVALGVGSARKCIALGWCFALATSWILLPTRPAISDDAVTLRFSAIPDQDETRLREKFAPVAKELEANIDKILEELKAIKGKPVDIGGYYHPCADKVKAGMRPSATLNKILATLN